MSKRKRQKTPSDDEEEEGFVVEVITKARVAPTDDTTNDWEYFVKWAGYSSDEDTWEPAANLSACQTLLARFWHEIGTDNKDYAEGYEVKASKKWIAQERARFAEEFTPEKDEARKQKERAERRKEAQLAAQKKKGKKKQRESSRAGSLALPSRSASTSSVSRPATTQKNVASYSTPPLPSRPAKKKAKRPAPPPSDAETDSDDQPLASLQKRKPSLTAGVERSASSASSGVTSAAKQKKKADVGVSKAGSPSLAAVRSLFTPSPPPEPKAQHKPKVPARTTSGAVTQPVATASSSKAPAAVPLPKYQNSNVPPLPSRQRASAGDLGSATTSRPAAAGKVASAAVSFSAPPKPAAAPVSPVLPTAKPALPSKAAASNIPSAKPPPPGIPSTSSIKSTPTVSPIDPTHIPSASNTSSRAPQPGATPTLQPSGLSTKSRLSQGALVPLAPVNTKKNGLSGLNFKKNAQVGAASSPVQSTGSAAQLKPPRPKRPSIDPLFDEPEPEPMAMDMVDSPINDLEERSVLGPALSRKRSHASLESQADDFLRENFPPSSTAPPVPATDPQRSSSSKLNMPPPSFKKKWKWSGKLLMNVQGKTSDLGDIFITDLFPHDFKGPLLINKALTDSNAPVDPNKQKESFQLLSFHDLIDMDPFLRTSVRIGPTPSQHLARVGPSNEREGESMKILARFMAKKNFVSLVPTYNKDGDLEGHFLLFPPVMEVLCKLLKVPPDWGNHSSFIVALLPWSVSPDEFRRPLGLLSAQTNPSLMIKDWKKTMMKHKYQVALRVLKFPPTLHEWLSKPNRTYMIWALDGQYRGYARDLQTDYLVTILDQCKVTKAKSSIDSRVVFVHVGALATIRKMPGLLERRSRSCAVHFYTYGTHETVHPEYWGVREIYPCGGVVTFAPSALYEDPWGVVGKMKDIMRHPLWTSYLLPSVLGMAIKLCNGDEDPLDAFDRGVFVFDRLLQAIDDGEASIVRAPPLERNARQDLDPSADWLRDHWITRPIGKRRMLEFCMDTFYRKYANIAQEEWASAIEAEISEDLDLMQRQPVIMGQYRRYVVVGAKSDKVREPDGFEWLSNSSFFFNDDFHQNKS